MLIKLLFLMSLLKYSLTIKCYSCSGEPCINVNKYQSLKISKFEYSTCVSIVDETNKNIVRSGLAGYLTCPYPDPLSNEIYCIKCYRDLCNGLNTTVLRLMRPEPQPVPGNIIPHFPGAGASPGSWYGSVYRGYESAGAGGDDEKDGFPSLHLDVDVNGDTVLTASLLWLSLPLVCWSNTNL